MNPIVKKICVILSGVLVLGYIIAMIVVKAMGIVVSGLVFIPFIGVALLVIGFIALVVVLKAKNKLVGETLLDIFWR